MRKNNSYSKKNHFSKIDDIQDDRMFLSMKETLHNPLKVIKSKDLLNYFYKDNSSEKDYTKIYSTNKNNNININFSELEETNNKTDEKTLNKFIQEKDYEDIIYTTTPMIYPENNFDKIREEEDTNIITDTNIISEKKTKTKNQNKKEAFKQIKNIAKDITDRINAFQICE